MHDVAHIAGVGCMNVRRSEMRRALGAVVAVVLMTVVVGLGAAEPSDGSSRTPGPSAPIPLVSDCGHAPQHEPRSLYWCTSECSSYMTKITWKTWGRTWAIGFGTFVLKTTRTPLSTGQIRPCSEAIVISRPTTPAMLYDPKYETLCRHGKPIRVRLFVKASWWVTYSAGNKTYSTYPFIPKQWQAAAC